MRRRQLLLALGAPLTAGAAPVDGGLVLLMRHALTDPGVGDPPQFRLDDCSTQRNLSDAGREQARRIGAALKARGLVPGRVRSSAWCRCLDTARLTFGRAEPWAALNSVFQGQGDAAAQTATLRRALAELKPGRIEAWVSHNVNIAALTGEGTAMGEVLLLRAGDGRVVERIAP